MNITKRKIIFILIYLILLVLKVYEILDYIQVNENLRNGYLYLVGQPQLSVFDSFDLIFFIAYGYLFFKCKNTETAYNLMEFTFFFGIISLLIINSVMSYIFDGYFNDYYIEIIFFWVLIFIQRKFLLIDMKSFWGSRLRLKFLLLTVSLFNSLIYLHLAKNFKLTIFLTDLF